MSSYEIVRAIQECGISVTVVTSDHREAELFDSKQTFIIKRAPNVFLKELATKNVVKRVMTYIKFYYKYCVLVRKEIKDFKPTHIIVADEQTRNWYGFFCSFIKANPIVIASMPEKKSDGIKTFIVNRTLNSAGEILCVSKSTLEKMCETFGDKYRPKMKVLYRTINERFFIENIEADRIIEIKEKYNLHNRFVILSVCRLNNKKGIDTLIDAAADITKRHNDVRVIVVGEGPDRNRLEDSIREKPLSQGAAKIDTGINSVTIHLSQRERQKTIKKQSRPKGNGKAISNIKREK